MHKLQHVGIFDIYYWYHMFIKENILLESNPWMVPINFNLHNYLEKFFGIFFAYILPLFGHSFGVLISFCFVASFPFFHQSTSETSIVLLP